MVHMQALVRAADAGLSPQLQLPAPLAVPAQALAAAGPSAQHQCCQRLPGEHENSQQQQQQQQQHASAAVVQGGGDCSRRNAADAAPTSWAQQQPRSAPCTPEAACEASLTVSGESLHRAVEQSAAMPAVHALPDDPAGDVLMLRRLQSFVLCVVGSPLVQSALLHLEHVGEHPSALPASRASAGPAGRASAAGLEWTLSQLLALWLRAGHMQACESALLAALWVLESAHSAWRSPASVCLASYTKLVGAMNPEVVRRLTADWPAAFTKLRRALVEAQMDLLERTGWRVRLDLAADVLPCHALLFCPAVLGNGRLKLDLPPPLALPPAVAAMQQWAAIMRRLCAVIRETSRRLKAHEEVTRAARLPTPACEDEGERPAKRRCPAGSP